MVIPPVLTLISGGQTGVDRGALDAALAVGMPCGGWCPAGRMAEDGIIPARYPVTELTAAGYAERTRQNVADSDGALIITFGRAGGGTARTIELCRSLVRPHLIIDGAVVPIGQAAREALGLIRRERIRRLNVAGPRASEDARGYQYAYTLVQELWRQSDR